MSSEEAAEQSRAWFYRRLLATPAEPRTTGSVILWWEKRRIVFNGMMLVSGLPTVAYLLWLDPNWGSPGPLIVCGVWGILANVFYTAGWVMELVIRRPKPSWGASFGPVVWTAGIAFSLFWMLLVMGVATVLRLKGGPL